jgi:hypothetical protein
MNKVILVLLPFILFNCSTLDKNLIKRGEYRIGGGVHNSSKWEDDLMFTRISWFKELTLSFDLLEAQVGKESPFYNWFSEDEKEMLGECIESHIVVTYAWSPMQISRTSFFTAMEAQGFSRISIPTFQKNLQMHPNFARLNISLYKTDALCRKKISSGKLMLRFPGFKQTSLRE